MVFCCIVLFLAGAVLAVSGYMIAVRRNYALIGRFVDDRHSGKFDSAYAHRFGVILLLVAAVALLLGFLGLTIKSVGFSVIALFAFAALLALTLWLHSVLSARR